MGRDAQGVRVCQSAPATILGQVGVTGGDISIGLVTTALSAKMAAGASQGTVFLKPSTTSAAPDEYSHPPTAVATHR